MYTKENWYYKDESLSNAATWKEQLPESGLLSAIRLEMYTVNAANINQTERARLADRITKIEVTNGADKTMFSLRGQQVKALDFYELGFVPFEKAILRATNYQRTDFIIPFGRYLNDPEYMLDLSAWDSVYLEVINDLSTSQCADKATKMNVFLMSLEDLAAAPAKYIKNYEWRNEKPSANGQYVYHDLPTTERIRRVMLQIDPDLNTNGSAVADPKGDGYEMKFSFQQEKETVLEHRPKDLMRLNAFQYGLAHTFGRYVPSTTYYLDTAIADVTNMVMHPFAEVTAGVDQNVAHEESNNRFMKFVDAGGQALVDLHAVGAGYYHTMVPFDAMLLPEDEYLNPAKTGDAKGPVRVAWYGQYDDHTLRTCLNVPILQGAF